jgi:hypothetical protein
MKLKKLKRDQGPHPGGPESRMSGRFAGSYTYVTPRKERERLAEYLK